jgi:hypothetical protein
MSGDDLLRRANARREQIEGERRRQDEADDEYTQEKARELAEAFHVFLRTMKEAGNPGLERRPGSSVFRPKSWASWIYSDGTVSDYGPRDRQSPEEYALSVLSKRPRDGWGGSRRRSVDERVKVLTGRLVKLMADNGVELPKR